MASVIGNYGGSSGHSHRPRRYNSDLVGSQATPPNPCVTSSRTCVRFSLSSLLLWLAKDPIIESAVRAQARYA